MTKTSMAWAAKSSSIPNWSFANPPASPPNPDPSHAVRLLARNGILRELYEHLAAQICGITHGYCPDCTKDLRFPANAGIPLINRLLVSTPETLELTMKAAILRAPSSKVGIEDRKRPTPGPAEVLIRVRACGVCHGDLLLQQGGFPFARFPVVPGHEVAGEIAEVGEGVQWLKPGMREQQI